MKEKPVDRWIVEPAKRFINNSSASGIVLFSSAFIAIVISNSPFAEGFKNLWEIHLRIGIGSFNIDKSLHHWINDGLMAIFFFVVGLELKREILDGELSNPRKALLPIVAAIGGMIFPAVIYLFFNYGKETVSGWGIPMATDIAFALGILYLLGDRIPVSLKVFVTAFAIVDDIGAVLVIAFFYTSDINMISLLTGAGFMAILIFANYIGVRSPVFYGIVGIGGLWTAFLMSGVHATIAAVLAAFTIPADVKVDESNYYLKLQQLIERFKNAKKRASSLVSSEQLHVLEGIRNLSKNALTPLQRLEHSMHPLVAFIVMPVFALANAGVGLTGDSFDLTADVTMGVFLGLVIGKFLGVCCVSILFVKMKWASLPEGMNYRHLLSAGLLASIGFTMSLFITELAFDDQTHITQAKVGILMASLIAGIFSFILLKLTSDTNRN
ncbi:MAG: Na+/H+ antiporter NhaA [Ignavibacteria bacterium]|nr:Na+/H+ antiporter NhaA [Ignavibacteria bacterium]